jgi:hypothetical protein
MMLKKMLRLLFDNFSESKKNSQTLSRSSPVTKEVLIKEGWADISNENIGSVNAIK